MRHDIAKAWMTKSIIVGASGDDLLVVIETEVILVEVGTQCHPAIGVARIFPGEQRDFPCRSNTLRIMADVALSSGDAVG
jgi:hypothetical protein